MRLLLDTHLLIWAAWKPARLSAAAHALITNPENRLYFSPASLWEVAIKRALGRPGFLLDTTALRCGLLRNQYVELPINGEHAIAVEGLPSLHKDPFDRILLAQAIVEGIVLLTSDVVLSNYPGPIRRV